MATTELATKQSDAQLLEQVVMTGDLSKLNAQDRVQYVTRVCTSLGLNPLTRPFDYILLNNKLTLYAKRDATDQLRSLKGISITELKEHRTDDLFIVWATVRNSEGREDHEMGAVSIAGLRGEALANAMMKAVTKAKRRATLSICGLGWLDETEVDSVPDARPVQVDTTTGEIIESKTIGSEAKRKAGVAPKPDPDSPVVGGAGITHAQLKRIHALAGEVFGTKPDGVAAYKTWLGEQYQVDSSKQLTSVVAADAITALEAQTTGESDLMDEEAA